MTPPDDIARVVEGLSPDEIARCVHEAALKWCGEKDRETSIDDIRYFEANWRAFPGLTERVDAAVRKALETRHDG